MSHERSRAIRRWGITQNSADPQSATCGSALSLFIERWSPTNQSSLGILKHNPLQFSCRPRALCHSSHAPVQHAFLPPRCCRKVDTIKAQQEWDARSDPTVVSHPSPTRRWPASAKKQRWVHLPRRSIMKTPPSEWHSLTHGANGKTGTAKIRRKNGWAWSWTLMILFINRT